MLKNRMLATQQASELEVGNAAYEDEKLQMYGKIMSKW